MLPGWVTTPTCSIQGVNGRRDSSAGSSLGDPLDGSDNQIHGSDNFLLFSQVFREDALL